MGTKDTELRHHRGEHPVGDAGQLILLVLFLAVWVLDSFILRWTTFPAGYMPLYLRLAVTALLMVIAVCLERSGHVVVERENRLKGVKEDGAFRYVRHPLYLASLLFYLGLAISTLSLFSLAMLVSIFIFYDYIAGYEEKVMVVEFGEKYEGYMKNTGKWIPRTGRG